MTLTFTRLSDRQRLAVLAYYDGAPDTSSVATTNALVRDGWLMPTRTGLALTPAGRAAVEHWQAWRAGVEQRSRIKRATGKKVSARLQAKLARIQAQAAEAVQRLRKDESWI